MEGHFLLILLMNVILFNMKALKSSDTENARCRNHGTEPPALASGCRWPRPHIHVPRTREEEEERCTPPQVSADFDFLLAGTSCCRAGASPAWPAAPLVGGKQDRVCPWLLSAGCSGFPGQGSIPGMQSLSPARCLLQLLQRSSRHRDGLKT